MTTETRYAMSHKMNHRLVSSHASFELLSQEVPFSSLLKLHTLVKSTDLVPRSESTLLKC